MPINANYEYLEAEKKYLQAQGLDEKIKCLGELIKTSPGHKGAENLRAELRLRLKKLKEKKEKGKKVGKGKKGIKKEGFQIALIGLTNSGKSCLINSLTNTHSKISENQFTTKNPEIGTMNFEGVKSQILDLPSLKGKDFDIGIMNTANCLLLVIEKIEDLTEISKFTEKISGKKIIILNKIDLLSENSRRKLKATLKSKRLNFEMVSCKTKENIPNLKKKIFESMKVIRIYTKEPGKKPTKDPIVLPEGSTVRHVAEEILKGFSKKIKETRLTGPSGKFANQIVGLNHKLKDKDIVEFKT
ncbi:hypothetical protein CXX78_00140 [Candidatus Parvarchaeota archaeon]|jgi:small GTP-binding protein|nr:MAG: hypothetical protein CXX78_01365 [Candidatus Parvarchaeota archaeon]PXY71602.1 MAG: hypothetical protein CXX78_00140 [Candidatus Parvarchaeota archaeon]HIG52353.1 TGS domain-containing protein [Candidatus Pacearchaeota archaeon]